MKDYRMPFEYFRDAETRLLERTQPDVVDSEAYFRRMLWRCPDGRQFLLNNHNRKLIGRDGPFRPPYHYVDELKDKHAGEDAFVFCPGPSMALVDPAAFRGRLTLAVNSAGFRFEPRFWCIFESNYLKWFMAQTVPPDRTYIMTARCAVRWRAAGKTRRMRRCYVPQFEEARNMPNRTPAVTSMGALVTAWYLGCRRAWIVGLDLSRPNKKPYVEGVPHSKFGATNPFDDQVKALRQFKLPDFEVMNVSPHSREKLPQFTPTTPKKMAAAAQKGST